MANKSKAKGTRAESAVVKYFRDHGIQAERRALTGSKDEGDIKIINKAGKIRIVEVKAGKQTQNPNRTQLEEWLRQARAEEFNSGISCALCVVRYNRKLIDADVYVQYNLPGFDKPTREHLYLDEFVDLMI